MKRGFTMVETLVGTVVFLLLMTLLFSWLTTIRRGEKGTDADGALTITLARFLESMQQDLRSSAHVEQVGDRLEITRWIEAGEDGLESRKVSWSIRPGSPGRFVLVRDPGGGNGQEFDLPHGPRRDGASPALVLERMPEVQELLP